MTDGVFARRVVIVLGLAMLGGLVGLLLIVGIDVLLLAFAGLLVALFLRGLASFLRHHSPFEETGALVAVVIALLGVLAVGGWFIAPALAEQAVQLADQLPSAVTHLRERLASSSWGRLVLQHSPEPESLARSFLSGRSAGAVAATLGWIVGGAANVVIVLFIGLYVAFSPDVYRRGLLRLAPATSRRRAGGILDELGKVLQRWLVGKAAGMLIIGALTTAGLALVGVPAPLALGAVAGVLNFVPYLGPVLSFVPAALLGATQSSTTLAWVLVLYVVIQSLESYIVTPLIQQKAVALPPALIITAQVLAGVTIGWLGLLLATPLTACVVVLVSTLYIDEPLAPRSDHAERQRDAAA